MSHMMEGERLARMLSMLSPWEREDYDVNTLMAAGAAELDRIEDMMLAVRDSAWPHRATDEYGLLSLHERMLNLPVAPAGASLSERQAAVKVRMGRRKDGRRSTWEQRIDELVGADNWYYERFIDPAKRPTNKIMNPKGAAETGPTLWEMGSANTLDTVTLGVSGAPAPNAEMLAAGLTTGFRTTTDATGEGPYTAVDITTGQLVHFSAYVRATSLLGGAAATLKVRRPNGTTRASSLPLAATGVWTRLHAITTADVDGQWQFAVKQEGAGSTAVYWTGTMLDHTTAEEPYQDGDSPGWEWLGSPELSASRKTSPPPDTITIWLRIEPEGGLARRARELAEQFTPVTVQVNVAYESGFILGVSELGEDAL